MYDISVLFNNLLVEINKVWNPFVCSWLDCSKSYMEKIVVRQLVMYKRSNIGTLLAYLKPDVINQFVSFCF